MLSCLPTIVRGHDIDSFVVRALDHMASVFTDVQQPATIPCPWYTAVWHLKTQLLLEPLFSGHPQPRSQGSLLPVPTGRRENLGMRLRSPSGYRQWRWEWISIIQFSRNITLFWDKHATETAIWSTFSRYLLSRAVVFLIIVILKETKLRVSPLRFLGCGISLIWGSGLGILKRNWGEIRDWKYALEEGCQR